MTTAEAPTRRLFAYLCAHQVQQLQAGKETWLRPGRDDHLVWLTDLEQPILRVLIPGHHFHCTEKPMRFRVVDTTEVLHWPQTRGILTEDYRWQMELLPGGMPMHWYVSTKAVKVVPDQALVT